MKQSDLADALENHNVQAFLRMLRVGEGTSGVNGYKTHFGGELFESYDDHPRRAIRRGTLTSTAAGAYQFLERTWDGLVRQYGFEDFSPPNQDKAAVALIAGRGALNDVILGNFDTAVHKCNKEWASLPGSPYGQPVVSLARARNEYEEWGGDYGNVDMLAAAPTAPLSMMFAAVPAEQPAPKPKLSIPWFDVLRAGSMVRDPATWKTRVGLTMFLTLALGVAAQVAKGMGYAWAQSIDQDTITAVAGAIAAVIGLWGNYATTDKVGVLPARPPTVTDVVPANGQATNDDPANMYGGGPN